MVPLLIKVKNRFQNTKQEKWEDEEKKTAISKWETSTNFWKTERRWKLVLDRKEHSLPLTVLENMIDGWERRFHPSREPKEWDTEYEQGD